MANSLQRHKTADAVKWFVTFVLLLGVIASVVTLFIQVDRNTTVTQIGAEAYKIAALDGNGKRQVYRDARRIHDRRSEDRACGRRSGIV